MENVNQFLNTTKYCIWNRIKDYSLYTYRLKSERVDFRNILHRVQKNQRVQKRHLLHHLTNSICNYLNEKKIEERLKYRLYYNTAHSSNKL